METKWLKSIRGVLEEILGTILLKSKCNQCFEVKLVLLVDFKFTLTQPCSSIVGYRHCIQPNLNIFVQSDVIELYVQLLCYPSFVNLQFIRTVSHTSIHLYFPYVLSSL